MAKRLWDKGDDLNNAVHAFTVGKDPLTDLTLLRWDAIGSAAHVRMLNRVGLLSDAETEQLLSGLCEVLRLSDKGEFTILPELEDCHTAIEAFLTEQLGEEVGGKVHTGRSRNDQVLLAMRLYLRDVVLTIAAQLSLCADAFLTRSIELKDIPMPGYTHLQRAMPTSVGAWLHAFAESCLDLLRHGVHLLRELNQNPLGAASGFYTPLPLDRDYVAELLGMSRAQRSSIDIMNSRGRYELRVLRWISDICTMVEKFSWDGILYCTEEFGFISLPKEYTTGSSIMPQKRNPDVLELCRARAALARGAEFELVSIISKLPSNYHRDFQLTKEPVVRSVENVRAILAILPGLVQHFTVNKDRLENAMGEELYVTYDAYRKVNEGRSFRDAYRTTAEEFSNNPTGYKVKLEGEYTGITELIAAEIGHATTELQLIKDELNSLHASFLSKMEKINRL